MPKEMVLNTSGLPHIPYSRSDNSQTADTSSADVKETVPESHSVSDVNQVETQTYEVEVSVTCSTLHYVYVLFSLSANGIP